jgi:hypothetical protein
VASYLADLRRGYPPEEAERLLQSLHGGPLEEAMPPPKGETEEPQIYSMLSVASPPTSLPEAAPPMIPPPYRPEPASPAAAREEEGDHSALSNYLCTGLFVIVLATALALAGHVFVRPFLPL